jgi:hypothetical protein
MALAFLLRLLLGGFKFDVVEDAGDLVFFKEPSLEVREKLKTEGVEVRPARDHEAIQEICVLVDRNDAGEEAEDPI